MPPDTNQLVHVATLAANSHNTQPWRFTVTQDCIVVRIDPERRCPVVDPEDRHVIASLGCAMENMVVAGPALGVEVEPHFDPEHRVATARLSPIEPRAAPLLAAIAERQSSRCPYRPKPLPAADLEALVAAVDLPGVRGHVFHTPSDLAQLTDLVVRAHQQQARDPAFVAELGTWIRFNRRDAERTGDGLYSGATGNPDLPTGLGRAAFPWFFHPRLSTRPVRAQMHGTAVAFVLTVDPDEPRSWFAVGRVAQRLQLVATTRGIRSSFMNQPVEVASIRRELTARLGQRPALLLRFGRGDTLPRSYRRPVEQVRD